MPSETTRYTGRFAFKFLAGTDAEAEREGAGRLDADINDFRDAAANRHQHEI